MAAATLGQVRLPDDDSTFFLITSRRIFPQQRIAVWVRGLDVVVRHTTLQILKVSGHPQFQRGCRFPGCRFRYWVSRMSQIVGVPVVQPWFNRSLRAKVVNLIYSKIESGVRGRNEKHDICSASAVIGATSQTSSPAGAENPGFASRDRAATEAQSASISPDARLQLDCVRIEHLARASDAVGLVGCHHLCSGCHRLWRVLHSLRAFPRGLLGSRGCAPVGRGGGWLGDGNTMTCFRESHVWKFKFINMKQCELHVCEKCGALRSGDEILKSPYGRMHVEPLGGTAVDTSVEPIGEPAAQPAAALACPKCRSTQLTAGHQGFGLGKAAVGGVLLGGVGLLGGFFGAGKVKITCMQCGHAWRAGKK